MPLLWISCGTRSYAGLKEVTLRSSRTTGLSKSEGSGLRPHQPPIRIKASETFKRRSPAPGAAGRPRKSSGFTRWLPRPPAPAWLIRGWRICYRIGGSMPFRGIRKGSLRVKKLSLSPPEVCKALAFGQQCLRFPRLTALPHREPRREDASDRQE